MPVEITPVTVSRQVTEELRADKVHFTKIHIDDPTKVSPEVTIDALPFAVSGDDRIYADQPVRLYTKNAYAAAARLAANGFEKFGAGFQPTLDGALDLYTYVQARQTEVVSTKAALATAKSVLDAARADVQIKEAERSLAVANDTGVSAATTAVVTASANFLAAQKGFTDADSDWRIAQASIDPANPKLGD